jgi:polysaccharide chain length determinant protein (PEP-CTERM system associated)
MQPHEGASVPRRPLDVEDYIDIVRRHRGWIFGPLLLVLAGTVVGVYLMPDTYVSQATVKVEPQQVPENMVQAAVNQEMTDRIGSMSQTILSRTTLTIIINNFGLYPRERKGMPIEDVVEMMRKKIGILPVSSVGGPGHEVPAFVIQFAYENRFQAQRVVSDLVSRFLDENMRSRANATAQTTQFMKDETDEAKRALDDVESQLAAFKVRNNGHLPDQADGNDRRLEALDTNSTYLSNSIFRASQEKLQLEGNLRIIQEEMNELNRQPRPTAAFQKRNEKLEEAERELDRWNSRLVELRQRFKDNHPDVQTALARLDTARKWRDELLAAQAEEQAKAAAAPPAPAPLDPQVQRDARDLNAERERTEYQIEAKKLEIEQYNKQLTDTNARVKVYQARLDETAPEGEKEYLDLIREREIARENYQDRENKLSRAQIAKEMEDRKQGEFLELLDPASLPTTPTEPKRPVIISLGAGIGLLIGFAFAGAREMKDTSLKNLKDVRAYTQMAILGSIPLLENDLVVRRRRRLAWLAWTTACFFSAVAVSMSILYHWVGNGQR